MTTATTTATEVRHEFGVEITDLVLYINCDSSVDTEHLAELIQQSLEVCIKSLAKKIRKAGIEATVDIEYGLAEFNAELANTEEI